MISFKLAKMIMATVDWKWSEHLSWIICSKRLLKPSIFI